MLCLRARLALVTAAALLGMMYVLPVWRVTLAAPQYPEGLGMQIWLDTITGIKPNDLDNINNLNHYIGMKRIVPESIPELRLMPAIVGVLVGLAALAAATRNRKVATLFVVSLVVLAIVGLVDFYRWEYDYGHNLDLENAIIKIPGMSYQPPLIGTKQLLNFTASSWPGPGGLAAFAALILGIVALRMDRATPPRPSDAGRVKLGAVAA
jgi:copper chaperone NosL